MCVSQGVLVSHFDSGRGGGAALVFHKPEQVVNGNQIYLGKRMKRIPPALSLSFVCWPDSPVVSLFTDYKVPKG